MVKAPPAKWGLCSRTVTFSYTPEALTYWKDIIAVGLASGNIITLDAITGIRTSVLSGHTGSVGSLIFSSDGVFLVSGSDDSTINLWDVQTGGVVKTFHGHTSSVLCVSISPNCATIASGSKDNTVRLWNIQTGDCFHVIKGHNDYVNSVVFSPTNSQLLISASNDNTIQHWDINGHQIGPIYKGDHVAFSSDGTMFVSWEGKVALVQNSDSGQLIAQLQAPSYNIQCCCFSPDGKFVAGGAGHTICLWDIASSDPHLVKTYVGHTNNITSLIFSSSLLSSSKDKSTAFWQIGDLLVDPVTTDPDSTPSATDPVQFVSLQTDNGVAISRDSAGVVRTWDVSTGLCKASFHTPAKSTKQSDLQLISDGLVVTWYDPLGIHIWGSKEEESKKLDVQVISQDIGLRMSGDGSKVFLLDGENIQAWSTQTGEVAGKVRLKGKKPFGPLIVNGSRVWVCSNDLQPQGWDFGISGSTPIPLSSGPPDRPCLEFIKQPTGPPKVRDTVAKEDIFWLCGGYAKPPAVQWDGRYLVLGCGSGEVLILDFNHAIPW